jgi:hypothetical protein
MPKFLVSNGRPQSLLRKNLAVSQTLVATPVILWFQSHRLSSSLTTEEENMTVPE